MTIIDERDQLASNISEVMEVAGDKVDCDVDLIRKKYNERIQILKNNLSAVTYSIYQI